MTETEENQPPQPSPPLFLEVECKSSGKVRRFAAGTESGYALFVINRKLGYGSSPALHIEAVKEGEEPISFGPRSFLVNYGEGWKLQTVTEEGFEESSRMQSTLMRSTELHHVGKSNNGAKSDISFVYIGKILLVFAFIFLLGGILTVGLENLPQLLSIVNIDMNKNQP
ncbi:hypothetical protein QJS04_geneDACA012995 [Acorus gramineus]|uniref:Uncharacterized protein n=1 Tax=Acorus gramineus TaxID=55184 RepID=A0AAV9B3G2_ACOGR|nr:hypothetical protein QJS04_geneDACA012995 [Acorus gramineus]